MSEPVEQATEADPLKGGQEDASRSDEHGCAGKLGMAKLSGWRTAAFLLSVFLCLSIVFAFSFILPCPVRPQYLRTWNLTLPDAATYNFLVVADVSKDKVLDVLLMIKSEEGCMNHTCTGEGLSSPCLFLLAVSGTHGASLWERPLSAEFRWAQCGLGGVGEEGKLCLVAHDDKLTAIDIHTGGIAWQRSPSPVANGTLPVISLPDVDKDGTNDIAVLSYTSRKPAPVELVFLSGKRGNDSGSKVIVDGLSGNISAHLQYTTSNGAQYLLLYTDSGLYAQGLWRLATKAQTTSSKLKKEKSWEKRADKSGIIPLYESVSLQDVFEVKSESSSASSPPLLLHTDSTVMLLNPYTLTITWTTNTSNLLGPPSFGYYNKDGVLDIVLEEKMKNATKRVVIIDGQTGGDLWQVYLPFQYKEPQPASILTINYFSVFMLWGKQYSHNGTSWSDEEQQHATYLLHPLHPDILLERSNPAQNIIAFKVTLLERGRHACYLILTGEDATKQFTNSKQVVLTKRKIKDDVSESSALKVEGADGLSDDVSWQWAESVKEAFHRLRFSDAE